ncbi:hypothetical protein F4703DRAFT_1793592 [Phycomyces blakesleeanus]
MSFSTVNTIKANLRSASAFRLLSSSKVGAGAPAVTAVVAAKAATAAAVAAGAGASNTVQYRSFYRTILEPKDDIQDMLNVIESLKADIASLENTYHLKQDAPPPTLKTSQREPEELQSDVLENVITEASFYRTTEDDGQTRTHSFEAVHISTPTNSPRVGFEDAIVSEYFEK